MIDTEVKKAKVGGLYYNFTDLTNGWQIGSALSQRDGKWWIAVRSPEHEFKHYSDMRMTEEEAEAVVKFLAELPESVLRAMCPVVIR